MFVFIKFVGLALGAPAVAGFAAAGVLWSGVISAKTGAPSSNPAAQSVLVYGQR